MEIRVHGPGQEPRAARGDDAHARATTSSSRSASAAPKGCSTRADDLAEVAYCLAGDGEQEYNVVTVAAPPAGRPRRPPSGVFVANASCGLCGKTTLDEVAHRCDPVGAGPGRRPLHAARSCPTRCAPSQTVFDATGGLHAAGALLADGELRGAARGRRPAQRASTSSSVTRCSTGALPLSDSVLMVSGRVSFEIVQKAAVAGIPIVVRGVGAVEPRGRRPRERFEQTLVGFLRDGRGNVYTHPERIDVGCA